MFKLIAYISNLMVEKKSVIWFKRKMDSIMKIQNIIIDMNFIKCSSWKINNGRLIRISIVWVQIQCFFISLIPWIPESIIIYRKCVILMTCKVVKYETQVSVYQSLVTFWYLKWGQLELTQLQNPVTSNAVCNNSVFTVMIHKGQLNYSSSLDKLYFSAYLLGFLNSVKSLKELSTEFNLK